MHKSLRVALVAFIVGLTMLLHTPNAFAEQALTTVTCADPQGNQQQFEIGWDNSNQFFEGKGYIPRLFCEGGFAQPYTTYISDTLPADSPLGYYAGIVPEPEPTPLPSVTVEPTPEPSVEVSPQPSPTPIVEPTPEPSPTVEPSPSASPTPPSPEPTEPPAPPIEPTPAQTPEPQPTPPPEPPALAPQPPVEASPPPPLAPEPPALAPAPPIVIELPPALANVPGAAQVIAAAEAIMNIGSDMTTEQREESQAVVVGAVLVGQIAASIRKVK